MSLFGYVSFCCAVAALIVPCIVLACKAKSSSSKGAKLAFRSSGQSNVLKHFETHKKRINISKGTKKSIGKIDDKLDNLKENGETKATDDILPNAQIQNGVSHHSAEEYLQEGANKYSLIGALETNASNSSDMSTDDTLMIEPIRITNGERTMAVIEGEQPIAFSLPHANFSSSSDFAYFNHETSRRDMKDQLLRLHRLNKPAALRAAADLCESIISPTTTLKSSQTVLMKGEKRTEECFIDDDQLMTAVET
uniref:Uncharacterized protein n=1 Tax=Parascaris univalens TaxID=6257 RepID=A0A915CIF1_PARUN